MSILVGKRCTLIRSRKSLTSRILSGCLLLLGLILSPSAFSVTGITYTGRILDSDNQPVAANQVYFQSTIYDEDSHCWLYKEERLLDLSDAAGTFSFNIGSNDPDLVSGSASFNNNVSNLTDVFNNAKTFTGMIGCTSPNSYTPSATSPRVLVVLFRIGTGSQQALPPLTINPVPSALQAYAVNGYGSGDLLKVDSAVNKATYANDALNQAQYDEFWKLILGTSTTYLKAIPTLGGDISGTLPAVSVDKIKGKSVATPATSGDVLTYNGTSLVWQATSSGGITSLNGLAGSTQSFATGTSGSDFGISSSGSAHTFNLPSASATNRGALTSADWTTFNAKQSSALTSGSVWVGNVSGAAQARAITGDITIDNTGGATLKNTGTAGTYSKVVTDAQGRVVSGTSAMSVTDLPALNDSTIWIGNSGNTAVGYAMSGDATMSNVGLVTLKSTGSVGTYSKVVTDAQGRVVSGSTLASSDITTALGYTPVNKAGDTMSGALAMGTNNISNTGNISMAANKYFSLSANSTDGTVAGQIWYDAGTIKYFDGTTVKSLGVAGAGITNLNGLSSATQSFVVGSAGNAPAITSSGSAHTLDIPMAAASGSVTAGLISNSDYVSFSGKQSNALTGGQVWVGNASNVAQARALSGDIASISNTGLVTATKTTTAAANTLVSTDNFGIVNGYGFAVQGSVGGTVGVLAASSTSNYTIKLPATTPVANQIMQSDAAGNLSWINTPSFALPSIAAGKIWVGNSSGGPEAFALSGDIASVSNTGLVTLKNTGTVGTYWKVVTDAQGRVSSGSALASGDVTTALGYTPGSAAGAIVKDGNSFGAHLIIGTNDNYDFRFETNNATAMTIEPSGEVGIGTTTPGYKLDIVSTDGDALRLNTNSNTAAQGSAVMLYRSRGTAGSPTAVQSSDTLGGLYSRGYGATNYGSNSTASIEFSAAQNFTDANRGSFMTFNTTANNSNSPTEAMRINQGGDIGIGTSSPISKVHVHSTANADNAVSVSVAGSGGSERSRLHLLTLSDGSALGSTSNNRGWAVGAYGNSYGTGDSNSLDISFWGGATWTTALHLGTTGYVGIGSGVPSYSLDMNGKTDAIRLPAGTTAQQPANAAGLLRYNTSNNIVEFNNGSGWTSLSSGGSLPSISSAQVYVGNSSNGAQARTLSGDITISNVGLVTVDKTQAAAASKILQLDSNSVATTKGLDINGTGSGTISFRGQAAAGTYTLTFPNSAGSSNQFLQTDGSGNLSWATPTSSLPALASAKIWVGNSGGAATSVSMSNDATIDNAGALTIANNAITSAKISDGTIVNADLSSTAAIARTKIANGTAYGIVVNNASGGLTDITCSTTGHVLTWNGTQFVCQAPSGGGYTISAKSANFTVTTSDTGKIFVVSNLATATLPAASSAGAGFNIIIKRTGASNVTITPNGADTIDGNTSATLSNNYSSMNLVSTGSAWVIIGSNGGGATSSTCVGGSSSWSGAGTYTLNTASHGTGCVYTITLKGAGGGTGYSGSVGNGGAGGGIILNFAPSTAGQVFDILIGGKGTTSSGGYGGGGDPGSCTASYCAGGGGGATAIKYNSTALAVAGGGGGGGYGDNSSHGGAGGSNGGNGSNGQSFNASNTIGRGGTNAAGGAGGTGGSAAGAAGGAPGGNAGSNSSGAGGAAVPSYNISGGGGGGGTGMAVHGGGGGGGYGGGGGGANGSVATDPGGGGGGSGWYSSTGEITSTNSTSGAAKDTDGSVTINWN